MTRRKKKHGHVSHERWLISYGDFLTLLFALFVVMYASSQADSRKAQQLAQAIEQAFQQMGILHTPAEHLPLKSQPHPLASAQQQELDTLAKQLRVALAPEIENHQVGIQVARAGVVVSLREAGFYDSGSATLLPGAEPVLENIATAVKPRANFIRIEGHTDNVPIHNARFSSNWELSTARATEMVQLFITRFGLPPQRLAAAGYAQYHPAASNSTAAGRALNRRVDVVILPVPAAAQPSGGSLRMPRAERPYPAGDRSRAAATPGSPRARSPWGGSNGSVPEKGGPAAPPPQPN